MFDVFVEPHYPNKRLLPYKLKISCRHCAERITRLFCKKGYNTWVEKDGKLCLI
jgi:hypothetical protein